MLSRLPALADIGAIAAMAHERLDGSGYHRRLPAAAIPLPARILAAADAYQTKLEPRPHRPAQAPDDATAHVHEEAAAGRLDARAVQAVIAAAGLDPPPLPTPNGLTPVPDRARGPGRR